MSGRTLAALRSLADPTRLRIISLVNAMPGICVCQIVEAAGLPQTTVSKALGVLKRAGLVTDKRDGQWIRYSLADTDNGLPLKEILRSAALDMEISKDLLRLEKIKKIPLHKICCNKPWRKTT